MTNITPDMLTAYALGELPIDDAPAVEAHLAEHRDARAFVEEVRATAGRLADALRAEPVPTTRLRLKRRFPGLALAAMLALGLALGFVVATLTRPEAPREPILNTTASAGKAPPIDAAPANSTPAELETTNLPPQEPAVNAPVSPTEIAAATQSRDKQVNELLLRARELQKSMRYAEAIDNLNQVLWLNPHNVVAAVLKDMCEDAIILVEGRQASRQRGLYRASLRDGKLGLAPVSISADGPKLNSYADFAPTATHPGSQYSFSMRVIDPNEAQLFNLQQQQGFDLAWPAEPFNREAYDRIIDNPFLAAIDNPLSTFSIDVDTASYANVRRFLTSGTSGGPPPDAVRIEEMVNYFEYDYEPPSVEGEHPFAAHVEVARSPWNEGNKLVRIGLKGKVLGADRPDANLVFLLDVSGSMNSPDKLPLVKNAMKRLTQELRDTDRAAIVVYAGASGLVLDSTPGSRRREILDALDRLEAGGSTNGGAGIELAYATAQQYKLPGVNRVILCTDGDFNVGVTDRGQLTRLIEEKAASGVYLSILAFGTGNLQDATMEELSNKGDGNYAYIDSLREAQRVLIEQMEGTLVAIAKDVKIQVEFNPARAAAYRLIGYENRVLAKEDFNDDTIDAGDIGSGHTVTALYEVMPATSGGEARTGGGPGVDDLKYQKPAALTDAATSGDELLTLKLRYKPPDAPKEQGTSTLIEFPVTDSDTAFADASQDCRFAASVAAFGMLLRGSPYAGGATLDDVLTWAKNSLGDDEQGYRAEFVTLAHKAKELAASRE